MLRRACVTCAQHRSSNCPRDGGRPVQVRWPQRSTLALGGGPQHSSPWSRCRGHRTDHWTRGEHRPSLRSPALSGCPRPGGVVPRLPQPGICGGRAGTRRGRSGRPAGGSSIWVSRCSFFRISGRGGLKFLRDKHTCVHVNYGCKLHLMLCIHRW